MILHDIIPSSLAFPRYARARDRITPLVFDKQAPPSHHLLDIRPTHLLDGRSAGERVEIPIRDARILLLEWLQPSGHESEPRAPRHRKALEEYASVAPTSTSLPRNASRAYDVRATHQVSLLPSAKEGILTPPRCKGLRWHHPRVPP